MLNLKEDIMSDAHYDMHKRKGYSSDEPYPEIKVLGPVLCRTIDG